MSFKIVEGTHNQLTFNIVGKLIKDDDYGVYYLSKGSFIKVEFNDGREANFYKRVNISYIPGLARIADSDIDASKFNNWVFKNKEGCSLFLREDVENSRLNISLIENGWG